MASSHNPFRTPAATPTPTGTSTVSSAGPASSDRTEERSSVSDSSVNDLLTEELPPAYTPSPNVYEGEATLELGPRRPFQQSQPVPFQPQPQFPPQSWGVPPQSTGGSSWSNYPGQRSAPPVHPDLVRPSSTPIAPSHPVSDFVRDFYAAGAGSSDLYGGSSAQYESNGASSSSGPRYAPPLGEPAHHGKGGPPSPNTVPDDGRPTGRPVPGHPLLRHGKVLVYPHGYECMKCRNTGYKNFDPSHPCTRCWDKYARPFAGAIAYAPWSAADPSSTHQRPLPNFRTPQSALHAPSASWSGPARADLARSATTSRVGGYPGTSAARVVPIAGGAMPMSPYLDRMGAGSGGGGRGGFPPASWGASAPPGQLSGMPPTAGNVVVYPPGDSRIGGRLCWRCGGRGKTAFFIFDEETCGICNGVGRTFV